jgi:hypothetical protein
LTRVAHDSTPPWTVRPWHLCAHGAPEKKALASRRVNPPCLSPRPCSSSRGGLAELPIVPSTEEGAYPRRPIPDPTAQTATAKAETSSNPTNFGRSRPSFLYPRRWDTNARTLIGIHSATRKRPRRRPLPEPAVPHNEPGAPVRPSLAQKIPTPSVRPSRTPGSAPRPF